MFTLCVQALTKRSKFIRDIVREVSGFAPYEKRAMELLRISKDKRCLKFCKKRVRQSSLLRCALRSTFILVGDKGRETINRRQIRA